MAKNNIQQPTSTTLSDEEVVTKLATAFGNARNTEFKKMWINKIIQYMEDKCEQQSFYAS